MNRFAYIDDDVNYDEYGIKPRKEYEPILERDEDEDEGELEDDYLKEQQKTDYYDYEVVEGETLTVNMRRERVDYTGLSDYPTLHSIIREINPSQIICWHGPQENRDYVVNRYRGDQQYVIHTAENQQTIEVVSRYNFTKVRLDDALLKVLHQRTIGDYEIA